MFASVRFPLLRAFQSALILSGTVLLGTCTDGRDPAGLMGESQLHLAFSQISMPELAPDEVRPIERIRITAHEVPGGEVLGRTTVEVDPGAGEWTVAVSLPIPVEATVVVILTVELISLDTGGELVEWSGRTGSITLRVGTQAEVGEVLLVKGPPANLAVTGVSIGEPAPVLREGQAVQLTATAQTTTPQDPPIIFWRSLNPGVATVSGTGLVEALSPGMAGIVARAGAAADTAAVTVLPRPDAIVLEPERAVLASLGEEVAFQARVLDPRGNPIPGGGGVTWSVADARILQSLGGGAFRALSRGTTTVRATSVLDPNLSGTAQVVVRQVVAAVQMIPEEAAAFIGEPVGFQAVALDARENPIQGMAFSWSTPDPEVATVDGSGVATGLAAGEATIRAQAVSGEMGSATTDLRAPTPGTTGFATLMVLPPVSAVVVTPSPFRFRSLGETRQFTAQALDSFGNPLDRVEFTWSSSNETVLTVNGTGLATSVTNGEAVVEARVQGIGGVASVSVSQAVAAIHISPPSWSFFCTEGCDPQEFEGMASDALGYPIPGRLLDWWVTDTECSSVIDPPNVATAVRVVVDSYCSCWNGQLAAFAEGITATASIGADYCGPQPTILSEAAQGSSHPSPWFSIGVPWLPF